MIWLDRIEYLQYYNQPKGAPCYCEIIVFPSDMVLQGVMSNYTGSYTMLVEVLSADGLTVYENATTYFEYYYFIDPVTSERKFNLRLKSFAPSMCTHACFIMHVTVTQGAVTVFDRYTERYCQSTCCDLARDIDISQDGLTVVGGGSVGNPVKYTECGDPLITLRTQFDCYDYFLGNFFGIPPVVLSGTASFSFQNVTNMRGRIVRRPREISREYSYNCRLQRVESKPIYRLEGFEYFAAWKMNEIEAQFSSSYIEVEGREYKYAGGTPFTMPNKCVEIFKLDTILEDCMQRQVFGCDTACVTLNYNGAMKMFVLPGVASGPYYDESGNLIAEDYAGLLVYIRGLDGITAVTDLSSSFDCGLAGAFSLSGTAYIPSSFYYSGVTPANRVYGAVYASEDDVCPNNAPVCPAPETGTATITAITCDAPTTGTVVVTEITPTELTIVGSGDWEVVDAGTEATVSNSVVSMDLEVINNSMAEDPGDPGVNIYITTQVIAVISVGGRPTSDVILNSTNSVLPADTYLTIATNGQITYTGYTTAAGPSNVTIELTGINYNL